jgi:hypothetical protein
MSKDWGGGWSGPFPESVSSQRDAELQRQIDDLKSRVGTGGSSSGASSQTGPCAGNGIEGSTGFIIARRVDTVRRRSWLM